MECILILLVIFFYLWIGLLNFIKYHFQMAFWTRYMSCIQHNVSAQNSINCRLTDQPSLLPYCLVVLMQSLSFILLSKYKSKWIAWIETDMLLFAKRYITGSLLMIKMLSVRVCFCLPECSMLPSSLALLHKSNCAGPLINWQRVNLSLFTLQQTHQSG